MKLRITLLFRAQVLDYARISAYFHAFRGALGHSLCRLKRVAEG